MATKLLFPFLTLSALFGMLAACSNPSANILEKDETRLETGDDLAQYHYLVKEPYSVGLSHEGYIIGIEKSPRTKIGNPFVNSLDTGRFRYWTTADHKTNDKTRTEARNSHIKRVADDGKSMFVSHILSYCIEPSRAERFAVSPLYLGYNPNGFLNNGSSKSNARPDPCVDERHTGAPISSDNSPRYYETGWAALDTLGRNIEKKLTDAEVNEQEFTHIIVAAMGWNNNQVETVRRYNALTGNIVAQADQAKASAKAFKPLIIGLTWPSVWGGESYLNFINTISHIISYPNKSDDADEIGYTIANVLINDILQELKSRHNLKIVLIGHSMGARMLSRAMFSGHLIQSNNSESYKGAADLFIGLQGAFSVRRFREGFKLPLPMSLFRKGEGSPYLLKSGNPGRVVLTWATDDKANPAASWITGAAHAGAEGGYKETLEIGDKFYQLKWRGPTDGTVNSEPNTEQKLTYQDLDKIDMNRVLMVDADLIVNDHNDILDPEMGRLIWDSIAFSTIKDLKGDSGFVDPAP